MQTQNSRTQNQTDTNDSHRYTYTNRHKQKHTNTLILVITHRHTHSQISAEGHIKTQTYTGALRHTRHYKCIRRHAHRTMHKYTKKNDVQTQRRLDAQKHRRAAKKSCIKTTLLHKYTDKITILPQTQRKYRN